MIDINYAMGMSRTIGSLLTADQHLKQSIDDIIMTPLGSRLMRRDYGSLVPFLIDSPMNPGTRLKLMSAIATAIIKWEPRVRIRQVQISMNEDSTNTTGNIGWNALLDLRRADNSRLGTSLVLVRGAS